MDFRKVIISVLFILMLGFVTSGSQEVLFNVTTSVNSYSPDSFMVYELAGKSPVQYSTGVNCKAVYNSTNFNENFVSKNITTSDAITYDIYSSKIFNTAVKLVKDNSPVKKSIEDCYSYVATDYFFGSTNYSKTIKTLIGDNEKFENFPLPNNVIYAGLCIPAGITTKSDSTIATGCKFTATVDRPLKVKSFGLVAATVSGTTSATTQPTTQPATNFVKKITSVPIIKADASVGKFEVGPKGLIAASNNLTVYLDEYSCGELKVHSLKMDSKNQLIEWVDIANNKVVKDGDGSKFKISFDSVANTLFWLDFNNCEISNANKRAITVNVKGLSGYNNNYGGMDVRINSGDNKSNIVDGMFTTDLQSKILTYTGYINKDISSVAVYVKGARFRQTEAWDVGEAFTKNSNLKSFDCTKKGSGVSCVPKLDREELFSNGVLTVSNLTSSNDNVVIDVEFKPIKAKEIIVELTSDWQKMDFTKSAEVMANGLNAKISKTQIDGYGLPQTKGFVCKNIDDLGDRIIKVVDSGKPVKCTTIVELKDVDILRGGKIKAELVDKVGKQISIPGCAVASLAPQEKDVEIGTAETIDKILFQFDCKKVDCKNPAFKDEAECQPKEKIIEVELIFNAVNKKTGLFNPSLLSASIKSISSNGIVADSTLVGAGTNSVSVFSLSKKITVQYDPREKENKIRIMSAKTSEAGFIIEPTKVVGLSYDEKTSKVTATYNVRINE